MEMTQELYFFELCSSRNLEIKLLLVIQPQLKLVVGFQCSSIQSPKLRYDKMVGEQDVNLVIYNTKQNSQIRYQSSTVFHQGLRLGKTIRPIDFLLCQMCQTIGEKNVAPQETYRVQVTWKNTFLTAGTAVPLCIGPAG